MPNLNSPAELVLGSGFVATAPSPYGVRYGYGCKLVQRSHGRMDLEGKVYGSVTSGTWSHGVKEWVRLGPPGDLDA